jgi:hypothetical protein
VAGLRTFRRAYRPPNGSKDNYDDVAGLDGAGRQYRFVGTFSDVQWTAKTAIRTPLGVMDSRIQDLPVEPLPTGGHPQSVNGLREVQHHLNCNVHRPVKKLLRPRLVNRGPLNSRIRVVSRGLARKWLKCGERLRELGRGGISADGSGLGNPNPQSGRRPSCQIVRRMVDCSTARASAGFQTKIRFYGRTQARPGGAGVGCREAQVKNRRSAEGKRRRKRQTGRGELFIIEYLAQ